MMPSPRLRKMSGLVMILSLMIIIGSLVASAVFFRSFLHEDRTFMGVVQAFFLFFGMGSTVYVPACIVFFMAHHVLTYGPKRSIGWAGIFMSLPLCALGLTGVYISHDYWIYAAPLALIGAGLLMWSMSIHRHLRRI
jgi:hypothetical protein